MKKVKTQNVNVHQELGNLNITNEELEVVEELFVSPNRRKVKTAA